MPGTERRSSQILREQSGALDPASAVAAAAVAVAAAAAEVDATFCRRCAAAVVVGAFLARTCAPASEHYTVSAASASAGFTTSPPSLFRFSPDPCYIVLLDAVFVVVLVNTVILGLCLCIEIMRELYGTCPVGNQMNIFRKLKWKM